jgi:SecD-like export protein
VSGAQRRGSWGRALVGAVVLCASLVACGDDDDGGGEGSDASGRPVAYEDHWHAAFGVYVCDAFLPPIPQVDTPAGIHTHGDDVIHIHPFIPEAAGENATLGLFLDDVGIPVSSRSLTAGGETYTAGEDTCGDEQGEVVVVRWADVAAADAEPERVDTTARFRHDGEGYVVAFVPDGADVPKPESAGELEALGGADGDTSGTSGASTTSPPPAPAGPLADGFYEVQQVTPAPCPTPGMPTDGASENCYVLSAEPALGTEIVEDAEASVSPGAGNWQVGVTLTEAGLGAFNDVAARCYRRDATCPLGQLALVIGDEVVFAPTLQEPSYERDQISVSGSFTEDEARSIADALTG